MSEAQQKVTVVDLMDAYWEKKRGPKRYIRYMNGGVVVSLLHIHSQSDELWQCPKLSEAAFAFGSNSS